MKLPFIILKRSTFEQMLSFKEYQQKVINDHRTDLISSREEVRNLRFNYEELLSKFNHVCGELSKLRHKYNVLKKKSHASS